MAGTNDSAGTLNERGRTAIAASPRSPTGCRCRSSTRCSPSAPCAGCCPTRSTTRSSCAASSWRCGRRPARTDRTGSSWSSRTARSRSELAHQYRRAWKIYGGVGERAVERRRRRWRRSWARSSGRSTTSRTSRSWSCRAWSSLRAGQRVPFVPLPPDGRVVVLRLDLSRRCRTCSWPRGPWASARRSITLPLWSHTVARRILGLPLSVHAVLRRAARLAARPLRPDDTPAGRRRRAPRPLWIAVHDLTGQASPLAE